MRLEGARKEIATCAISGAVGTFANIDPTVEAHVAHAMGLEIEPISTQVIPRDRHAMYFSTLAVTAPFHSTSNHVINQLMFVCDLIFFKF